MTRTAALGLAAALVAALTTAPVARADTLAVTASDGRRVASIPMPAGGGWCVLWNHSVAGFEVADCYENRDGAMTLVTSRMPDFAAGLDHIPGRGQLESDGRGGYVVVGLDEPVPGNAYLLRAGGPSVDHRIGVGTRVLSLSAVAAGERVRISLEPGGP